jgi:transposase
VPWRDVPEVYAPWQMLYRWFRRWQRDGTWAKVLTRLQTVADEGDDGSAGEGGEVCDGVRRPARRVVGAATVRRLMPSSCYVDQDVVRPEWMRGCLHE